ncbi:MAG TPA: hypothetical protein PLN99_05830, partial [Daejeonella sp.]|nr:hypothetical protein [Daejeonella sp.]
SSKYKNPCRSFEMTGGSFPSFRTQQQYILLNVVIYAVEKSVVSGSAFYDVFFSLKPLNSINRFLFALGIVLSIKTHAAHSK